MFQTLKTAIDVFRSGLFDSSQYVRENPDVNFFLPILHWVMYGVNENRESGQSAFSRWLLPYCISGRLSSQDARKLRKSDLSHNGLKARALTLGLNTRDYDYFKLLASGNYNDAYNALEGTSPGVFFDGVFHFAARHSRVDMLDRAYELNIEGQYNSERLSKKVDIAQALGRTIERDVQNLVSSVKSTRDDGREQIYRARLPVLRADTPSGSDIYDAFYDAGLDVFDELSEGSAGEFAKAVSSFANLITAAGYNRLSNSPVCITGKTVETTEFVPLSDCIDPIIKVRVLMPHYWVEPQSSHPVTGSVLRLQKALIQKLLSQGVSILPIFATPIFDITDEDNFGLPTLSYHTLHRNINTGLYLHYKEAYLPDYFMHDSHGFSGWSSLSNRKLDSFPVVGCRMGQEFHSFLFQKYCVQRVSKYEQKSTCKTLPDQPFIFVALQVPEDTVAEWAYMKRSEWLATVCCFSISAQIPVVIKRHPKDNSQATDILLEKFKTQNNVHVSEMNIHDLIPASMVVVTVNSGVGFEALLHHKPVITCGASDYMAVTDNVKTSADLTKALTRAVLHKGVDTQEINTFLHGYLQNFCWFFDGSPIENSDGLSTLFT